MFYKHEPCIIIHYERKRTEWVQIVSCQRVRIREYLYGVYKHVMQSKKILHKGLRSKNEREGGDI
jgi:hypothetical protein